MSVLRAALCADFAEEQWPSMDRVANELASHIRQNHAETVALTMVCPAFRRRATRLSSGRGPFTIDRALNRWVDYPRHAGAIASRYDLFHIVDHSYAHLVHRLPAARTVVTCHDLDTFRSVLRPEDEPRSAIFRLATRRILSGFRQAAWITCDTAAVRDELLAFGLASPQRVSVVSNGVGQLFSPEADDSADRAAERLVASPGGDVELLHVGSTIARKRIDTLLAVCAALARSVPSIRLVLVGGALTAEQQRMVHELGLADRVAVAGFVDERTLAALYRRAALMLLPSEREGFGLPVIEAMASGTPVIASSIPALREVGGAALEYCPVGDIGAWVRTVSALLEERRCDKAGWRERQQAGRIRAQSFSWSQCASRMTDIYQELVAGQKQRAMAS